jgi:hypothetical protein
MKKCLTAAVFMFAASFALAAYEDQARDTVFKPTCHNMVDDCPDGFTGQVILVCTLNKDGRSYSYTRDTSGCVKIPGTWDGSGGGLGVLTKTCPDGSTVPVGTDCPPETKTCPDGSIIPIDETCPPKSLGDYGGQLFKTCPDGSIIPVDKTCPPKSVGDYDGQLYKICPDGSSVPAGTPCPACRAGMKQYRPCEECGTQERDCVNGDWGSWGRCLIL